MIWLLAATLQSAAPPQDGAGGSAVEMFRNACEYGELRLSADRAKIVQRSDIGGGYLDIFGWDRAADSTKYVEIMQPPSTYLFIEQPTEKESKTFSVVCRMATRSMSSADGDRAFVGELKDPKITFAWGDQFRRRFTIDRPDEGFRKRLWRSGAFTYLDVAVYRDTSNPSQTKGTQ